MDKPLIVNGNAAWCWFQDERARFYAATQQLVVGSIAAPEGSGGADRAGNVELAVVGLRTGTADRVVLHENFEADDHDVPVLWHRAKACCAWVRRFSAVRRCRGLATIALSGSAGSRGVERAAGVFFPLYGCSQ
ncbi:hypothetical protein ACFU98_41520 [Streptomyces sp. NPDC057575]|uniref:hypothetical protein n=1 Tax=unclassified Streptomyces TaxID=2593676 RepID=UPI003679F041